MENFTDKHPYKDYKNWMALKAHIHNDLASPNSDFSYREGLVYWMNIGENIGYEEDGKGEHYSRPVLVVAGLGKTLFLGAPITTKKKDGKYYVKICVNGEIRYAMLNQIRSYDTARVHSLKGKIRLSELRMLKQRLINLILV